MNGRSIFLNGRELPLESPARSAGALLLERAGKGASLPRPEEFPYLFCGNGACRDCSLQIDGCDDVPSCRFPPAPGMSFRTGEGAGDENALSRSLASLVLRDGPPLEADLIVVGAGLSGGAAAEEARSLGIEPLVLDAREGGGLRPVSAESGRLFLWEAGSRRELRPRAIVLATGARAGFPRLPGAALEGVLSIDLLGRYLAAGGLPGRSLVVEALHVEAVEGTTRVERVRLRSGAELPIDFLFVRARCAPQLSLAKALGCRTLFDRSGGVDRLFVDETGSTSVRGVFASGDLLGPMGEREGIESGARAARSAVSYLGRQC